MSAALNSRASGSLLVRLDARDRALFERVARDVESRGELWMWTALTHLGGATSTILAGLLPILMGGRAAGAAWLAARTLVVSHLAVQLVKRTVGRPRPSLRISCATLVAEPDRFSFPSGHSAASMSIAFGYAVAYPSLTIPLLAIALIVGASHVRLGVHYPGDVLMGQLLALLSGAVLTLGA